MFTFDKKTLYIMLTVIGVMLLANIIFDLNSLEKLLYTIPGVLIGITFHEFAHAFAADRLGDDTSRRQGRLTLNPFKHTDPIGLVMLFTLGFGWGKPVQVDSRNLTRKMSVDKAEAIISAAGPIMNFILAILFSIIMCIVLKVNNVFLLVHENIIYDEILFASQGVKIAVKLLLGIVAVNLGLGLFNLIPLPPLDGSKILNCFLSTKSQMWFRENEQFFYIGFIVLWVFGIFSKVISPIISLVDVNLIKLMGDLFKVIIYL